jgi:1L-myo-inositol 1-phosphate cytidylyltransferase
MNCLILAAGLGTRLREVSESKPLTPIAGVPLIEHVVHRAAVAGASRFVVVTGHEANQVERFLSELSERVKLPIVFARAQDWRKPNGYSVLAGSALIDGDYLLSMSDHLFDPAIARALAAGDPPEDLVLAVDSKVSGELIDLDDATKVAVSPDGTIDRIGKNLEDYNAIDTGVFRAGPGLAQAIRTEIESGGVGSLSAGVQRLARAGRARAMDVGNARWIDVDDRRMLALAEALVASESLTGSAA